MATKKTENEVTAAPEPECPAATEFLNLPLTLILPSVDNQRSMPKGCMDDLAEWFQSGCQPEAGPAQLVDKSPRLQRLIELAHSVARVGVVEPALVRPIPGDPCEYDLRAGERRYWASYIAGKRTLPCLVREMSDAEAMEVTVLENMLREDLDPIEEGESVQAMLQIGWERQAIAAHIGKTPAWVARRAAMATLVNEWRQEYYNPDSRAEEILSVGHLELIARVPRDVQLELLQDLQDSLKWVYHHVRLDDLGRMIAAHLMKLSAAPWKLSDAELAAPAGACTKCPQRSNAQPDLFDDMGKVGRCLHKPCWDRKLAAHLGRLQQEHPGIVLASRQWNATGLPKGTLTPRDYSDADHCHGIEHKHQVLVVDGADAGAIKEVVFYSDRPGSAAKPVGPKTLADKRAALDARRIAKAIDEVRELLHAEDSEPVAILEQPTELGIYCELVRLSLVFGFRGTASYGEQWQDLELRANPGEGSAAAVRQLVLATWAQLRGPISETLTYIKVGDAPRNEPAAKRVCTLIAVDWAEILTRHTAEIPEPKAWAKEEPKA